MMNYHKTIKTKRAGLSNAHLLGIRFFLPFFIIACHTEGSIQSHNDEQSNDRGQFGRDRLPPLREIEIEHTIHLGDYGAIPNDGKDDLPALLEAIEQAVSSQGSTKVEFDPGTFDILTDVPQSFCAVVTGAHDLIIEGNNAEIVVHNPQVGFIEVFESQNVIVRNLSVDYNPLPFIQAVVDRVDVLTGDVELNGMEGFPLIDDQHFVTSFEWDWGSYKVKKGILKDKNDRGKLKAAVPNTIGSISQEPISGRRFRINVTPLYARYFDIGDHYVHLARGGPSVFKSTFSDQVTFENLTVYTGPGAAFLSGNSSQVNLINCRIMMRDERWQSTCADGIIAYGNRVGPWIENCLFEGIGDDAVNINTAAGVSIEQIDDRTFVVGGRLNDREIRQHFYVVTGDRLRVYDPTNGVLLGEGKVVALEPIPAEGTYIVTLSEKIENVLTGDDVKASIFYNDNTVGQNFVIRKNVFRNTRRYGILSQSHDGLIEDNLFQGVSGNGIVLMNTIHSGSGFAPRNILISGNTFRDCYYQQMTDRGDSHAAIVGTVIEKLGYEMAPWQGIENIIIENNTIYNWDEVNAIQVSNGKNIIIRNNIMKSDKDSSNDSPVPSTLKINNSTGVYLSGNTITDDRIMEDNWLQIGENVQELHVDGNALN